MPVKTGLADPEDEGWDRKLKNIAGRFGGLRKGVAGQSDNPEVVEMRKNRNVMRRTAANAGGTGSPSSLSFATGRPRDPLFYWRQNNLPYDTTKDEELKKIREFCRLLYQTHPVIASCIDIFS